jgi:hypothetical protein
VAIDALGFSSSKAKSSTSLTVYAAIALLGGKGFDGATWEEGFRR